MGSNRWTISILSLVIIAIVSVSYGADMAGEASTSENPFGTSNEVLDSLKGDIYYLPEGTSSLPDFSSLTPVGSIYAKTLDVPQRSFDEGFPGVSERFEWFAIRYTGAFTVDQEGEYAFRMVSDDGSRLIVDGKEIINNDGVHAPQSVSGKAFLSRGQHKMEVDYFQGPRYYVALQLFWTRPGGTEETANPQYVPRPPSDQSLLDHTIASEVQESTPYDVIRRTDRFSPGDKRAYSWLSFGKLYGPHQLKWSWYSPDGNLYSTGSYTIPEPSEEFWDWYRAYKSIDIAGSSAAQMSGEWHVDIDLDGKRLITEKFTIESTTTSTTTSTTGSGSSPCSSSNPPDLTGIWSCDDGGTYYIKQIEEMVWWLGEPSPSSPEWSNVACGEIIDYCTVYLDYADIPKGSAEGSGSIVLEVISNNEMIAIEKPDSYGGSRWWRGAVPPAKPPGPQGPTGTNPWEDPSVRQLIDEWLLQNEKCVQKVYPGAYVDKWGRICGSTTTAIISCTLTPDKPADWDNYHYLWANNWCPDYYPHRVQDYVMLRQQGNSFDSLAGCKGKDDPCY